MNKSRFRLQGRVNASLNPERVCKSKQKIFFSLSIAYACKNKLKAAAEMGFF